MLGSMLDGRLDLIPPPAGILLEHPGYQAVHGRIALPQGLGHRAVFRVAGGQIPPQNGPEPGLGRLAGFMKGSGARVGILNSMGFMASAPWLAIAKE